MDPFLSFTGDPWSFGTGNIPSFGHGNSMPVAPQLDLPSMFANGLAAQGIRPAQFFANPEIARQALQPSPAKPNVWDPTPVPGTPQPPQTPGANMYAGTGENFTKSDQDHYDVQNARVEGDLKKAKEGDLADRLMKGLRGVQAPTAPPKPELMNPARAPAPPDPRGKIEAGELLKLLLSAAAVTQPQIPAGRQLPATLGAALGGMR